MQARQHAHNWFSRSLALLLMITLSLAQIQSALAAFALRIQTVDSAGDVR